MHNTHIKKTHIFRTILIIVLISFISTTLVPPSFAQVLSTPANTSLVPLSPAFTPTLVRGIKVYPDNPLKFDFIVDSGDTGLQGDELRTESEKLIRYFLASLTIPENDLWVNLSPYEKDRIVPNELGETEMGRDMLAQDYLLKQITASLTNPDSDLGKKFWQKVYKKAYEQYGTTNIPVDTFNKVWIMPEKAVVYEQEDKAFVVESKLKVMLEEDYIALANSEAMPRDPSRGVAQPDRTRAMTSQVVRDVFIPALENEVNTGKNFAQLRQIYNAIILGYWFKTKLKTSILNKVYSDQHKTAGIDLSSKATTDQIYQQYLDTFKKGVCNMMKVEHDPYTKKNIPRKYFAGGVTAMNLDKVFVARDMEGMKYEYDYIERMQKSKTYMLTTEMTVPNWTSTVAGKPSAYVSTASSGTASSDITQNPGMNPDNAADMVLALPYVQYALKPERELDERHVEVAISIDLRKALSMLYGELRALSALSKKNLILTDKENFDQRQTLFIESLRGLYRDLPASLHNDKNYAFYSEALQHLKKRRLALEGRQDYAYAKKDLKALQDLNVEAIGLNQVILKLQVLIAGMLLTSKSPLTNKAFQQSAALATLVGAVNTAKALQEELSYRVQRLRASQKIQEVETTDWMGKIVKAFRIGGFDIEVRDETPGKPAAITIRQQRYINAHTTLDQVRMDVKRGDISLAVKKLNTLIELYDAPYYKALADGLKALRQKLSALPDQMKPDKKIIDEVVDNVEAFKGLIFYPKQKVWLDVPLKNLEKGFKSQIETIAGNLSDYTTVIQNKADLENYAQALRDAAKERSLSARKKEKIRKGLTDITQWAARGFVDQKQFAEINLKPALEMLNNDDFEGAQVEVEKAMAQLESRLDDLESIMANVKKRAASIYMEYRDGHIQKTADVIKESVLKEDYATALEEITRLREFYFLGDLVELGLIRAEANVRKTSELIRRAYDAKEKAPYTKPILTNLELLKNDIVHKRSFRVWVTSEQGSSQYNYINPGTTVAGFLSITKRDPSKVKVSLGQGWLASEQFASTKIPEGANVVIQASSGITGGMASSDITIQDIKAKGTALKTFDQISGDLAESKTLYLYNGLFGICKIISAEDKSIFIEQLASPSGYSPAFSQNRANRLRPNPQRRVPYASENILIPDNMFESLGLVGQENQTIPVPSNEKKVAIITSPKAIDFEKVLKDLSLRSDLEYGIQRGSISPENKKLYGALFEIFKSGGIGEAYSDRLALTLATMKQGSIELIYQIGVLTKKEHDILLTKNAQALNFFNLEERNDLVLRFKNLIRSYEENLTAYQRPKVLLRLIPLDMISVLKKYYGMSRIDVIESIMKRGDFISWIPQAEAKVRSIEDKVGGSAKAWMIVTRHGLEKTDAWVASAEAKVRSIEDKVGGSDNAWIIVIGQGFEKTDAWVEEAKKKVETIQDKVGGKAFAWRIVTCQGLEKTDAWVAGAEVKVRSIEDKVGGSRNAWIIVTRQGLEKTDTWVASAEAKVRSIEDKVGGSAKAWMIVMSQGLEKTDAWVASAEAKVRSIQDKVGGSGNAWMIVMSQGLEKTDAWVASAEAKVRSIQDKVGGSAKAWMIVTRQGLEKTDTWVANAEAKVRSIEDKVGGSTKAWMIVMSQGLEKTDAWVEEAQKMVEIIQNKVGGSANAWMIVIGQGIEKAEVWVKEAKKKVETIQNKVGGSAKAWTIVMSQGLEKTDAWVEEAQKMVEIIQDKVGGKAFAWRIVIGQGIEKTDVWVEKAKKKVETIQDKVGGSDNAWMIVVGQGIEKAEVWVKEAKKKVETIQNKVGGKAFAWRIVTRQGIEKTDDWVANPENEKLFPLLKGLGKTTAVSFEGNVYGSGIERDTYIVLSLLYLMGELKAGENYQVPIKINNGGRNKEVDFVLDAFKVILEPHSKTDQWTSEPIKNYQDRRQTEVDENGLLKGYKVRAFYAIAKSNGWPSLYEILEKELGIEISQDEKDVIGDFIGEARADTRKQKIEKAKKEIKVEANQSEEARSATSVIVNDQNKTPGGIASSASLGNNSRGIETPGGIDFSAKSMNVEAKGQGVDFAMPADFENLRPEDIIGFTPVIISIVPVTDFKGLLGLDGKKKDFDGEKEGGLSQAKELELHLGSALRAPTRRA